jgi:hypothetical protein
MNDSPDISLFRVEVLPESEDRLDVLRYDAEGGTLYARVLAGKVDHSLTSSDVTFRLDREGRLVSIESIIPPRMWETDSSVDLPAGSRGAIRLPRVQGWLVSDFDNRHSFNPDEQVLHIVILPHEVSQIIDVSDRVRVGVDADGLMAGVWVALLRDGPPGA